MAFWFCHMRAFIALAGSLCLASSPASAETMVYAGSANTTLEVFQFDSGSKINSWIVPLSIDVELALMPFDSIDLIGIYVDVQQSVFEDDSHNFEFDFSLSATITGDQHNIERISTSDRWGTGFFNDYTDVMVSLDRIVFGQISHFESQDSHANLHPELDVIDIGGYPESIIYNKSIAAWSDWDGIFYAENEWLSFVLDWPEDVTLTLVDADFDHDGDLDGADFLSWQRGESIIPLSQTTLDVWQANFGNAANPIAAESISIPEPTTGAMLMMSMAAMLFNNTARFRRTRTSKSTQQYAQRC